MALPGLGNGVGADAGTAAPRRAIQEGMGHRDIQTTQVYADYAPDPSQGAVWAHAAFGVATNLAINLSETGHNSAPQKPHENAGSQLDVKG
jgi:hypothetical protein